MDDSKYCEVTNKRNYFTKNKARMALSALKKAFSKGLISSEPTYFYKCPHCRNYHLTTKDP